MKKIINYLSYLILTSTRTKYNFMYFITTLYYPRQNRLRKHEDNEHKKSSTKLGKNIYLFII